MDDGWLLVKAVAIDRVDGDVLEKRERADEVDNL